MIEKIEEGLTFDCSFNILRKRQMLVDNTFAITIGRGRIIICEMGRMCAVPCNRWVEWEE